MTIGLIGRKVGMTQVFQDDGTMVAVSVLSIEPNTVTRLRTSERELGLARVEYGADETAPFAAAVDEARAEVAEAFGISPLTVQSHVKNILAKLGVHSRVEAVRIAWRHGLADAPQAVPAPVRSGR